MAAGLPSVIIFFKYFNKWFTLMRNMLFRPWMLNFRICRPYTDLPQFIALHFSKQIKHFLLFFWFFYKLKGLWQHCTQKVYQNHFSNSVCSLLVFVSYLDNSCNISNCCLVIIFTVVSVISNVWCYYWNCLRAPWTTSI